MPARLASWAKALCASARAASRSAWAAVDAASAWTAAQADLEAARIDQGACGAQIFLRRHLRILEEDDTGLRRFGSGIRDGEIVAEIDQGLTVSRRSCADACLPGRNACGAFPAKLDR